MQAEKLETGLSFEKELNIVRDYWHWNTYDIEDRLKVEYEIDEDTLDQPVPPMMLQTLVENAIKHGISRQLTGGFVKIKSDFTEKFHELVIQNTGHLNGSMNGDWIWVNPARAIAYNFCLVKRLTLRLRRSGKTW
jgi:LytS/YehU family sensor histidine kinase